MCNVSDDLRELVKQRLAAAVEEIFELVDRALTGYEEETQRQRILLEQLLQPRVRVHRVEGLPEPPHIKEEPEPERPHVKQEQDDVISPLCCGLKTEELLSASTWDLNPPQTQPGEGSNSWTCLVPPTPTKEEQPSSSQDKEKSLYCSYTEDESPPLSYTNEGLQLSPSYTEKEAQKFTQPIEEPLPPSYTAGEPLSTSYALEEPLSSSYAEKGSQTFTQVKEDPLPSPLTPGQTENETQFLCAFCSKVFKCKSLLARHLKVHTGERPYRCSVCNRSFTRTTHLDRHFLALHGYENPEKTRRKIQRYSCVFCNQKCVSKYHLERHMKGHVGGAQFMQKKSLQQIHTQDTAEESAPWTAPLEDSTAPLEDSTAPLEDSTAPLGDITAPLEDITGPALGRSEPQSFLSADKRSPDSNSRQKPEKFMKCPICFKMMQTVRLSRHIMIHTGEKPFRCSVCAKRFNRKDALQAHMIVHSEDRPFTCLICGISKKRKADIREHMRIHTEQKHKILPRSEVNGAPAGPSRESANVLSNDKNICPICGKVVMCLKKHMQTHSGDRRFSCSVCGKRFSRNQHLQRHKVLHTRTNAFNHPSSDSHEQEEGKRSEPGIIYCRIDD